MHQTLMEAATASKGEEVGLARTIVERITGGRIDLYQCGERRAQNGWLQGRFVARIVGCIVNEIPGLSVPSAEREVVIDYLAPVPFDDAAEKALALYDGNLLGVEIAERLKCSKSNVTKLLKYAMEKHGRVKIDGRTRKSGLTKKQRNPPDYRSRMDTVMELWRSGLLNDEIAQRVGLCRDTITKVIREWHQERGLPVPDGRSRRKGLAIKSRPKSP
jgi:transposase